MLVLSLVTTSSFAATPSLSDYLSNVRDLQASVSVVSSNQDVLNSVNKDFAQSYKLKNAQLMYKEPGMLRVQGKRGFVSFVNICNGDTKYWGVGPLHGSRNVKDSPSQKQTLQDFGLLTAAQLADHNWRFVREEKTSGGTLLVFELHYKNPNDKTRKLIWVDPAKKVMVKRQLFAQWDGSLKLQYTYEDPQNVGGVWVPQRIRVFNKKLVLGAVSRVSGVKVNTGLSAEPFRV
jgi:outer membrane lipoprotein-sorting protein